MSRQLYKHLVSGDILGVRTKLKKEKKNPRMIRGRKRRFKKRK